MSTADQRPADATRSRPISWALPLLLLLSLLAYGGLLWLDWRHGTLRAGQTPAALGWYGLAFGAYLALILGAERFWPVSLKTILIWGALFRLTLLFTTPTLSDDIYRYMWDGYVANNGVSPYAHPIDSPALDYLDTPQRTLANNRWMASPYLPAAQFLFFGLTWLLPNNPSTFQAAMILLDLLNIALLVSLLRLAGLPERRALLYAWNPLIIVEAAHGAHVDTWMITLLLLALWLEFGKRNAVSGTASAVMLGLATLTKGLPVLATPVLFWRWRWWQMGLYGAVIIGLLLPAGLTAGWGLTGPLDGTGLFGAIRIYSDQWNFNSGPFHWLELLLTDLGVAEANRQAKTGIGLAMGLVLLGVWLTARRTRSIRAALRLMAIPFMAHILLTTTVHPWYLMTTLAFVPFLSPQPGSEPARRWLAPAPWLYLSWALPLSYLTYLDPLDFRELAWVRRIEWWPVLGLLLLGLVVSARSRLSAGKGLVSPEG